MKQPPKKEEYLNTLRLCEETKLKINELKYLLGKNVIVGLWEKYEDYSALLVNWIEEIEFNLVEIIDNE